MEETTKHVITQEDLDLNPEMVAEGVKVGDEIDLPKPQTKEEIAQDVYNDAIAAGETEEEAEKQKQEILAEMNRIEHDILNGIPEVPGDAQEAEGGEVEEMPEEVPETVSESISETAEVAEEAFENLSLDVTGKTYNGKALKSATRVAATETTTDALVLTDVDGVSFTLIGEEMVSFLA